MRRNGLLLLVVIVLGIGGYALYSHYFASRRATPPVNQTAAAGTAAFDSASETPRKNNVVSRSSVFSPVAPVHAGVHARYESSTDLFMLAQEMRELAIRGDPEALTTLVDIEFECGNFIRSDGDLSQLPRMLQKQNPALKPAVDAVLARAKARCQRFTKSDKATYEQMHSQLVLAGQKGSPSAKAQLMTMMDTHLLPDDLFVKTVEEIIASGDSDAIARLGGVMGRNVFGREQLFDVPAASDAAENAYYLAACQLGKDCGPNSQLLAQICLNGIGCGYQSFEALLRDKMIPPAGWAEERRLVAQIIKKAGHH